MKLASFETITEILPIEGADRIQLARVQGWQSVIRKDEYKVGDRVIFVPIDTVLPPRPWNKFLWDKNDPLKPIRVRTAKLKGAISQGLIFPTTLISAQEIWDHATDPNEDVSIAGMLGITKYEKPVPVHLAGQVAGDFPSHLISKTDEDNLKSNIEVLDELRDADIVEATVKQDGSSGTFIKDRDGVFRVCSRNLELKDTPENVFWQMARKYNLEQILEPGMSVQGEVAGPGIQGNPAGYSEVQLFVFNVFHDRELLNFTEIYLRLKENTAKLQFVPAQRVWIREEFAIETIDTLQEYVNNIKYPNGKPAEGLVFRGYRGTKSMYSERLRKMLSVKIINQNYKD
jgi:RNA ligase (TIGR02306 family)